MGVLGERVSHRLSALIPRSVTGRDTRRTPDDRFTDDIDHFYKVAMADGIRQCSPQFLAQLINERDCKKGK